jgi:hypothetical protein
VDISREEVEQVLIRRREPRFVSAIQETPDYGSIGGDSISTERDSFSG